MQNLKHYRILSKHDGPTQSCVEAECQNNRHGFKVVLDEGEAMGRLRATYVRQSDRRYKESYDSDLELTVFTFPPGETCFAPHYTVPAYKVDGQRHTIADFWVEDFAEHQDRIERIVNNG